jgi:hypothetical protein
MTGIRASSRKPNKKRAAFVSDPNVASRRANAAKRAQEKARERFREGLPIFLKNPETLSIRELRAAVERDPGGFPSRQNAMQVADAIAARKELRRRGFNE